MPEVSPEELDVICPPELINLVKCTFCQKNLIEEADDIVGAHVLVCFHSVCKQCVEGWNDSDTKFCPVCRIDIPKDLIDHKLLQEMVEKPHSELTRKGVCGMHTDTQATRWCHQCTSLVCDKCIKVHDQLKGTKTHDIVDATDILPTSDLSLVEFNCKLHPTMQFEIYCLKCEMMTCRNCQLEHHRQHNEYEFIADHCKEFKCELLKVHERMCQSEKTIEASQKAARFLQDDLGAGKESLRKDILKLEQQMIQIIEDRIKNLLKELDSLIDTDVKEIQEKMNATTQLLFPLKHCIQVVDLMLLQASDNTVIHSKKHLEKCFKLILQRNMELPNPDVRKEYAFHPPGNCKQLFEYLRNVGSISYETKNLGDEAIYQPIMEQMKLMNAESNGNAAEKSLNPPARIQLRQDLQSQEMRSMERVSIDSRASSSPDVGSMPHWHTPQEPPVPKSLPQVSVKKLAATRTNAVPQNQNLQVRQHCVQSAKGSYTITQVPNTTNQRMMPPDPSAPAMNIVISEDKKLRQTSQSTKSQPGKSMQRHPPPYHGVPHSLPNRNYSQPSAQIHQTELSRNSVSVFQSALRSNNVTLEPSAAFHPQLPPVAQILQQQCAQIQQHQAAQMQQQRQQLAQIPTYQQLQMPMQHNMQDIYLPGSTHNPYPQI